MKISQNRLFALVISAVCVLVPSFAFASFDTNLAYGSSDPAVLSLQQFLVAQQYPGTGSWMVTGYFGNATAAALREFQSQQGISPASGFFGPTTRARANQMSSNGNSVSTVTNTNSNDNSIAATIAALRAQIQQLEFQIAALSGGNTNNGNTTTQCTPAPIPATACSGTWSAATVSNGCTLAWQCNANIISTTPSITVTAPTVGLNIAQGNTLSISWSSQNAPVGSAVAIFIVPTNSSNTIANTNPAVIQSGLQTSGSLSYQVPTVAEFRGTPLPCPSDGSGADCGSYLTQNGPGFQIVAKLYTPSNALIQGMFYDPTRVPTYVATANSGTFTITAANTSGSGGPTAAAYPSDFNFDFQYGWGDELNTFNGTYTKFEGVGVPMATAAFSLTSSQMATIYSNIQTVLSDPTISAPRNDGTMQLPCDSETLKVQANGKIQTYTWNCSMNAGRTPSFNTGLLGWVMNAVQGVDASLPAPSGGLPQ